MWRPRCVRAGLEVIERIGFDQFGRINQRHEQIPSLGPVFGLVEE